ncbi:SDR family NAD(P)-dependent oxidoreductase [Paenibacillus sp. BK720]|uniref:SDR family NAD(P)-dependent oxidoreductase n=1 Tax=Paenibacillus sp. BK720 TaxID=2587092 RepID=UPI001420AC92|nr:SDR family NAD(P)-dependent oxidoreductase [Paenibacillus sp. BK720]NIK68366.1 NAD(P)-dependent dehydrogenase (short-subunit alcohol dehydrogenase family) [Paenibacillus sp. BK720]
MQQPIPSGYSARTTANHIVKDADLTGKIIIVTGGSAGLGLESARTLAAAGAKVVVPARNVNKASQALTGLSNVELYPEEMDLSKRETVEAFGRWFQSRYDKLDILINSAGIMAIPLSRDERGNEMQISANYLGHYHLIHHLLPQLKKANGARVVTLSSRAHWYSAFNFEDPNFNHSSYDKWIAYGQAKTAAALLSVAVDELFKEDNIRAFTVHPGSIVTGLSDALSEEELTAFGAIKANGERGYEQYDNERKTISEGAATIVWCAVSPQLDAHGGVYCENCDIAPLHTDDGMTVGVKAWAIDKAIALRLWEETPRLFN